MKKVLVSGGAGFIGFHLLKKLVSAGNYRLIAVDNFNPYYSVKLKLERVAQLKAGKLELQELETRESAAVEIAGIRFYRADLANRVTLERIFEQESPQIVVNLAAQAGVRYSLKNPYAYLQSNIEGFLNVLENCRRSDVEHLLFASSSSVYGLNSCIPFEENHGVDHPVSFYGATKRANELFAHSYSQNFGLKCTGLRFFTVYGPWGRPDMAYFKFAEKIVSGEPVEIYNDGRMERDFTYIDDIIEALVALLEKIPQPVANSSHLTPDRSTSHFRIFNIGNNKPENLLTFIELLEKYLGRKAIRQFLPMQVGDVERTWADISRLKAEVGFEPKTSLSEGLKLFVDWFLWYRKNSGEDHGA